MNEKLKMSIVYASKAFPPFAKHTHTHTHIYLTVKLSHLLFEEKNENALFFKSRVLYLLLIFI